MISLSQLGSESRFEELAFALLRKEKDSLKKVRGDGGDQGIDLYTGQLPDKLEEVYQCKYFKSGNLGPAQKKQIENSFKKAALHNPERWYLVVSLDLTK